jgi:hypothetical protein
MNTYMYIHVVLQHHPLRVEIVYVGIVHATLNPFLSLIYERLFMTKLCRNPSNTNQPASDATIRLCMHCAAKR